jgi:hypothetical protein
MIPVVGVWFLQNFAQVFLMGFMIVPDVFLMLLILMALLPSTPKDRQVFLIWAAFAGGLIWDLRWTNLPGLTAAINGGVVAVSCFFWHKIPVQGRSALFFAFVLILAALFSGFVHFVFMTVSNQVALRQILVQQLVGVPLAVIFALIYWKAAARDI